MNFRFLPRDAMHGADYAVARCLSHASILPKLLYLQIGKPHHFYTKQHGNTPTGIPLPLTGASNAWGYEKNAIVYQYIALSPK